MPLKTVDSLRVTADIKSQFVDRVFLEDIVIVWYSSSESLNAYQMFSSVGVTMCFPCSASPLLL